MRLPYQLILFITVWYLMMERMTCISEMQIQLGSNVVYNSSPNRKTSQYFYVGFNQAYSFIPECYCGIREMSTNDIQTNINHFIYRYKFHLIWTAGFYLYWYYDVASTNLGITKLDLDWICMKDYYDNIHSSQIYRNYNSIVGNISSDFNEFVPISSTKNIVNHYISELKINYPFNIRTSLVPKNTSLLTLSVQTATNNYLGYLTITYFIVNFEKFPSNGQYISSGTLELTTPTTQINFDYQNHEISIFGFQAFEIGSGGLNIFFNQSHTSDEKMSLTISGLNSAKIFYINFGTGSPLLDNQMLQFCTSRNSEFLCTSCQSGYSLTSYPGSCRPSINNCLSLDASNSSLCDFCELGHTLSSDKFHCTPNVEHCDIMRSFTECYQCDESFVLKTFQNKLDTICIPSIPYCQAINPYHFDLCDRCSSDSIMIDDKKCFKHTYSWSMYGIMIACGLFLISTVVYILVQIYKWHNLTETDKFNNFLQKWARNYWKSVEREIQRQAELKETSSEEIRNQKIQAMKKQFQRTEDIIPSI